MFRISIRDRARRGLAVMIGVAIGLVFVTSTPALAAPPKPAKPTNVTVTMFGSNSVTVAWRDNSSLEDGHWIYVNNAYSPQAIAANAEFTNVYGLQSGARYCFKVEAYNTTSEGTAGSLQSSEACITIPGPTSSTPGPAPTNAVATSVPRGLQIFWRDNSRNETAWIVTDGVTNRSFTVSGDSIGNRAYIWSGMQPNEYKCLRVRPYNPFGVGAYAPSASYVCGHAGR